MSFSMFPWTSGYWKPGDTHLNVSVNVCDHVHFPLCTTMTGGLDAVQWAKSELVRATPSLRCKEENFIRGTSLRQSQLALVMVDATVPGIIKGQPCQPCCSTSKACHKSQQIDRQAPTLNICPLLILWKRQNFESDTIFKFNTKWFILRWYYRQIKHPSTSQSNSVIYFFKVAYVHSLCTQTRGVITGSSSSTGTTLKVLCVRFSGICSVVRATGHPWPLRTHKQILSI